MKLKNHQTNYLRGIFACYLLLMLLLCCSIISMDASGETETYNNQIVQRDSYDSYDFFASYDETIEIDFQVTSGGKVDIYILNTYQYSNYRNGNPFTPSYTRENRSAVKDDFYNSDSGTYYIVVDNKDNTRESDAQPTGSVTYDLKFSTEDNELDVLWIGIFCVFGIIFLIIWIYMIYWVYKDAESRGMDSTVWVIIVFFTWIIGLIIYLVVRRDNPKGSYQTPGGYGPPPQPGYQPPPAYPYPGGQPPAYPPQAPYPPQQMQPYPPQGGQYPPQGQTPYDQQPPPGGYDPNLPPQNQRYRPPNDPGY